MDGKKPDLDAEEGNVVCLTLPFPKERVLKKAVKVLSFGEGSKKAVKVLSFGEGFKKAVKVLSFGEGS